MTIEKFFAEKFQKGGALWSIKECHEVFEAHPELKEDFQFEDVYMGPTDIPRAHYFWIGNADSSIGLHADMVIYSCMLQIHGRKHWKFYPPADKEFLYMETKGAIDGGMYSPLDVFSTVDLTEYPLFAKATEFNLILQPGDILYVPNGWWHAVYSMDATMSVNYVAERCNNISTGFLSAWWINDYLEGSRLLLLYLLRQMLTFITYILPVGSSSNAKKTETLLDNDTGAVWTPKSDEMEAKGK
ncbi:HSPB1-associated protein 1 [Seminavis robusta]|uniref:HSPB1-associated protein 1 n=1 Tax=Seminavis robusta TaxID=568900 RepID=A0A9N8EIC5_9STRA|nr:HSPB1-associated protein 1 [Seminavis robusta]|eukprot:Sro1147_g246430.1 HSPB1-associated protein 1 (243) ;mRNA; r:35239-35967